MNIDAQMMVIMMMIWKTTFLILALMYTFVMVRGIGHFFVLIMKDGLANMKGSIIITPAVLWGVFYLLIELTKFL